MTSGSQRLHNFFSPLRLNTKNEICEADQIQARVHCQKNWGLMHPHRLIEKEQLEKQAENDLLQKKKSKLWIDSIRRLGRDDKLRFFELDWERADYLLVVL